MKINKNNTYLTIAIYTVVTVIASFIGILTIWKLDEVFKMVGTILYSLYELFKPLIYGIIIAYLFDPIVNFYDNKCKIGKQKINFHNKRVTKVSSLEHVERWQTRTLPTFLSFLTLIAFIGIFMLVIFMNLEETVGKFSVFALKDNLNNYLEYFNDVLKQVGELTTEIGIFSQSEDLIKSLYDATNIFIMRLWGVVIQSLVNLGQNAMNILLGFVIAFYLQQDKQRVIQVFKKTIYVLIRPKLYHHALVIGTDIDYILSGYIRGELLDSIIVGTLISVALTLIKLDFALIIGVISGIFNLIPYFGPIVGFGLAIIIGILDPDPMKAVYGAIAILIIQQIDGCYIVPRIIGEYVKLHPIIVLLAILIGGNLFGLVGMLISVPIVGLVKMIGARYINVVFDKSNI